VAKLSAQGPAPVQATPVPATDPKIPDAARLESRTEAIGAKHLRVYTRRWARCQCRRRFESRHDRCSDYLLAIDATQGPIPANAFIAVSKQATGKDFGRLVNTHHHGDHATATNSSRMRRS